MGWVGAAGHVNSVVGRTRMQLQMEARWKLRWGYCVGVSAAVQTEVRSGEHLPHIDGRAVGDGGSVVCGHGKCQRSKRRSGDGPDGRGEGGERLCRVMTACMKRAATMGIRESRDVKRTMGGRHFNSMSCCCSAVASTELKLCTLQILLSSFYL